MYVRNGHLFTVTSNLVSYLTYDTNSQTGHFEGNVLTMTAFTSFTQRVRGQPMKVLEVEYITQNNCFLLCHRSKICTETLHCTKQRTSTASNGTGMTESGVPQSASQWPNASNAGCRGYSPPCCTQLTAKTGLFIAVHMHCLQWNLSIRDAWMQVTSLIRTPPAAPATQSCVQYVYLSMGGIHNSK